jgi:hypothetical protein
MSDKLTEQERAQLKCLFRSSGELCDLFEKISRETADSQLHDEYQKLSASAHNHQNMIKNMLGGKDEQ